MSKTRSAPSTRPCEAHSRRASPLALAARGLSLALYERNYFLGARLSRRFLPNGRYLAAFGFAAAVMSADPLRAGMRYLFAFVIGLFLASFFINWLRRPQGLAFSRSLPERATEGEPFEYHITVTNRGSKPSPSTDARDYGKIRFPTEQDWRLNPCPFDAQINAFDRWAGYPKWLWLVERGQDVLSSDFNIPPLDPGASVRIPARGVAFARGERLFLGVYCGSMDPLGLMRRLFYIVCKQKLLVLPKAKPCPIHIPSGSRSERRGDSRQLSRSGDSEEFRSLREWRSGDPLKRIDWKATARAGEPVTREFSPEFFLRAAIALDTYLPEGMDPERFEETLRRAAGLLLASDRKESLIDLLFVNEEVFELPMGRGKSDHLKAMERLAISRSSSVDEIALLERALLSKARAFSGVAFICASWDAARLEMATTLARSGVGVAILICSDRVSAPFPPGCQVVVLDERAR